MQKLKIVIIGPTQCGKTLIANALSEVNDNLEVRPTQGCRIVEFELHDVLFNQKLTRVLIELWDCSGQHKFNNCWPIIRHETNGVILVHSEYNLETQQELDRLYNYFIIQNGLSTKHCVVFNHVGDNTGKLSTQFSRISQVKIDLSEIEILRKDFAEYISSLLMIQSEIVENDSNLDSKSVANSISGI